MVKQLSAGSHQAWRTPKAIGERLVAEYDCKLDAAADLNNTLCPAFFDGTEGSDGLKQPWKVDGGVWCNPPYKNTGDWITKAILETVMTGNSPCAVLLVPAFVGTAWFTRALHFAECHLFNGRIAFDDPSGKRSPSFGNALFIFRASDREKPRTLGVTSLRSRTTGEILCPLS